MEPGTAHTPKANGTLSPSGLLTWDQMHARSHAPTQLESMLVDCEGLSIELSDASYLPGIRSTDITITFGGVTGRSMLEPRPIRDRDAPSKV